MREYELMTLIHPELDEAGLEAAHERIRSILNARGADLTSLELWGGVRRRLAYPIGHSRDAYYTLVKFKMQPAQSRELERALRLTEPVIRHLLIRHD